MRFGLEGLNILEIKQTGDLIKDLDKAALDSNYFLDAVGLRSAGDQSVAIRDFGTKHRFHCVPIRPNAFFSLTTFDTQSGLTQITTSSAHGFSNGDTVYIDESVARINGTWVISNVASTTFTLVGTTGESNAGIVGIVTKTPITIIGGTTFYDKNSQVEYEIIVGLDSSSNTRLYVFDASAATGLQWIELTRKIDCLINEPTSIAATDQTFDIDTITENTVTFLPTTNTVQYWVCVNTSKSNQTVFITSSTATALTVDTVIGSSGLNWANNDVLELYKFPAIKFNWTYDNGTTPDFDWMQIEQQRKVTMLYTNSATPRVARQPIQIMKRDARNYFVGTGNQATAQIIIAAPNTNDQVTVFAGGSVYEFFYNNTDPEGYTFSSADNLATQLTNITSATWVNSSGTITGTSNNGGTNGNTFYIVSYSDRVKASNSSQGATSGGGTRFFEGGTDGSSYAKTLPAGWYVESDYGILNPFYVARGSVDAPVTALGFPTFTDNLYDKTSGRNWAQVYGTLTNVVAVDNRTQIRGFITFTYASYQESDPVWQGFIKGNTDTTVAQLKIQMLIDFALMNKEITHINFYSTMAIKTIVDAGWKDANSEYILTWTMKVQDIASPSAASTVVWTTNTASVFSAKTVTAQPIILQDAYYLASLNAGNITINDALNHAVDKNRSYPTPTFVTKGTRDQGSIIVFNEGDTKLHTSLYDGYGVHQDDNFPDVAVDNNGNKMLIQMLGSSELLGLEILYDTIFAFRNNMIETYDLQGVPKRTYLADVVSKKSIVATPYGIIFAGKNAIYLIPSDGSEIRTLNESWNNYYGGNEYVTGSTQYITDAYRTAIISGYDDIYREATVLIQINTVTSNQFILHRYSFDDRKWRERRLNTTDTIKYFTKRQIDGTFTVGLSKGLLQYPNRIGSLQWEDDVRVNGAGTEISRSLAVPFTFTLNIARFNNQVNENVLHGFVFDFTGQSSTGGGLMTVEFFANDETTAFDTQYVAVDRKMDYRTIARRGNIERLSIAVTLPDSSIFKELNMKKITLGFISGTKLGNL